MLPARWRRSRNLANEFGLYLVEDAAQAHYAYWRNLSLGSIGQLGTLSFHETKNVISGEGGALIVNDPAFVERAEVLWQKGTNRLRFERGEISKYSWVDIGSSYLPSELVAAFLWAQLEDGPKITERRLALWHRYQTSLTALEREGVISCPHPPVEHRHNGHIFYVLLPDKRIRAEFLHELYVHGVNAVSHYVPLHSAPAGLRYGRVNGQLPVTEDVAARLIRLPLHPGMDESDVDYVVEAVHGVTKSLALRTPPQDRRAVRTTSTAS